MMNSNWNYPTTIWFGAGRIKELANACTQLNIKNPLFVTDEGLIKLDIVEKSCDVLRTNDINFSIYSDVQGNPTKKNIENGVRPVEQLGDPRMSNIACGSAISKDTFSPSILMFSSEFSSAISSFHAMN